MGSRNCTNMPNFILIGFIDSEEIQQVLFVLFFLIYLIMLLGNTGMILIIINLNLQLHTPIYFFLSHLSFLNLSYSTVIIPKTLKKLLTSNKSISFMECFTQLYFFVFLGVTDFFLLSSMAYDHYLAICNPLHYPGAMSTGLCSTIISGSYLLGFTESLVNIIFLNNLYFCKLNVISHFFCVNFPILALSRTDTQDSEIMIIILTAINVILSLTTILVSHGSILSTILKINSSSGKNKAFYTWASHLLGITIFYGTTSFIYLKPKNSYSLGKDQVASVFYTMVTPMLNPFIYRLRNREGKNALIRVMQKKERTRQLK